MGCDIHAHTEIRYKCDWYHYQKHDIDRDYYLFAIMAGVRNYQDITPVAEPRGLPPNLSVVTLLEANYMGTDGHSHSWLSDWEVRKISQEYQYDNPFWDIAVFGHEVYHHEGFGNEYKGSSYMDAVRLVFWFDN